MVILAGLLAGLTTRPSRSGASSAPHASDDFFAQGPVVHLEVRVSEADLSLLERSPRRYVRATVREGDRVYEDVGIHLKGRAGSFRSFHDKPALTLNFDKFRRGQKFHGLDKLHLNNSVQDSSYLNELICSELFLAAGVPTPRVAHARLVLNGRDRGLYVLKEGFDRSFLSRHFEDKTGNLYDGGFLMDITQPLEKKSGDPPHDRADLAELGRAAREPDLERRRQRLSRILDVDRFITFVVLEALTWHWDGYLMKSNNYKLYLDPRTGRFVFFPHGMDQMFGDPDGRLLPRRAGLVARSVLEVPAWRALYYERVSELLESVFVADRLSGRIEEYRERVRPALEAISSRHARSFDYRVEDLKARVVERVRRVREEMLERQTQSPRFDARGVAAISGWAPLLKDGRATLERSTSADGRDQLNIRVTEVGECTASWRARVFLPVGDYRFRARLRTDDVRPLSDKKGAGAGIRISGTRTPRTNQALGRRPWHSVEYDFRVSEPDGKTDLVCELRATSGEVWFSADSLEIVRLPDSSRP